MGQKLNVTIIGAGLAGLACARALRETHDVTVVERWGGGHEVGAAINLGPTAVEWLETMGFDRKRAGSIIANFAQTFNREGQMIGETDMTRFQKNCKADWLLQHRADLFNEFLRMATAPSGELGIRGEPAKVLWSTDAVHVNIESGKVNLADGRILNSDLVIGADGLKSIVRPLIVGDAAFDTARPSGASAFRFTIPADLVNQAIGDNRMLDKTKTTGLYVHLALDGTNRSLVIYPCRDFQLLNLIAIVPDRMIGHETVESWTSEGSQEELLKIFGDFDEQTKTLIKLSKDVKLWQLRDQDPLPTYVKGRVCLVGDAAHAMTPHQGQGGTQAAEDAEALYALFGKTSAHRESVPGLLHHFDRVRRPRASQIQSNTRSAHERKSAEKLYEHSLYNWTYPGFEVCRARLDAGQPMIVL